MNRYPSRQLRRLAIWAIVALPAMPAVAAELEKPSGDVVLTVTGAIARTNGDGRAEFDRGMLENLELHTLQTWTPWTEGEPEFTGVLAEALMAYLGATGTMVEARALNDYQMTIPLSDFEDYPVLVAMTMDGERLGRRDKGPLWIVYPWAAYPELDDRVTRQKSIWQLRYLHVK